MTPVETGHAVSFDPQWALIGARARAAEAAPGGCAPRRRLRLDRTSRHARASRRPGRSVARRRGAIPGLDRDRLRWPALGLAPDDDALIRIGRQLHEGAELRGVMTHAGDTPNLAARLQGLAESGGVVVSAATRHLIGVARRHGQNRGGGEGCGYAASLGQRKRVAHIPTADLMRVLAISRKSSPRRSSHACRRRIGSGAALGRMTRSARRMPIAPWPQRSLHIDSDRLLGANSAAVLANRSNRPEAALQPLAWGGLLSAQSLSINKRAAPAGFCAIPLGA